MNIRPDSPSAPAQGRPSILLLLPFAAFAWPTLAGLAARSEVPAILGRWSVAFFVFNLLAVGAMAWVFLAWQRGRLLALQLGYLALTGLTVLLPMNNQLRELPGMEAWMPFVRLAVGVAAMLAGFEHYRRRGRAQGAFMAVGGTLVVLSLLDIALLAFLALAPGHRTDDTGLRERYDLATIGGDDLVLVGDSFVWGQGVRKEERFGDVLEALFAAHRIPTRVFSLGQRGFGLVQYLQLLEAVPARVEAERVVVAFYMNDMPFPETLGGRIQGAAAALGRGFPTLRLVGDKAARLLTPDVEAYHALVVESYREDEGSYALRWSLLERGLADLEREAAARSREEPLLLMLPLMVDFADYPLERQHAQVADAARRAGFEVFDLLPVFRESLGDGRAHRSAPDDNHFDAQTHALVARELFNRLAGRALGEREPDARQARREVPERRKTGRIACRAAYAAGG